LLRNLFTILYTTSAAKEQGGRTAPRLNSVITMAIKPNQLFLVLSQYILGQRITAIVDFTI